MNEIVRTPEMIAGEINAIKCQVRNTALMASVEIGRRLKEAKGLVPEGQWTVWLEGSVEYSLRTAQNLMALASEYDSGHGAALEGLSYTKAVMLLGVPRYDREEFLACHDVDAMSTRELKETIRELQDQLTGRQMDMEELITAKDKEETERLESENADLRARLEQERESAKTARQEAEKESKLLKDKLNDERMKSAADAVDAGKKRVALENEITDLKAKLKKAEEKKEEKETPQEVEKELEELRRKANRSQEEQELRAGFDSLRDAWERLKRKLEAMEKTDNGIAERYKEAFCRALRLMADQAERKDGA